MHMGLESVGDRLFIRCYSFYFSTKYNTLSINTDQEIISAASLFLLPIQRTTAIKLL